MRKYLYEQLHYHFHHPKYLYFMLSLVLMLILPTMASLVNGADLLMNIIFGIVIFIAALYTTSSMREFVGLTILGAVLYGFFLYSRTMGSFGLVNATLTFAFFGLVFVELMNALFGCKRISLNEVYASVSGFLILGVMAAPTFFMIENTFPGAFNLPEEPEFYDFLYFSYITLTTIGFGDITPVHPLAKSITLLLGIVGQLYLTILIAIIIGKYLAYEEKK